MNQELVDQQWQELESSIHKMVEWFLINDVPAIEHKPVHVALLQMPADYKNEESEKVI